MMKSLNILFFLTSMAMLLASCDAGSRHERDREEGDSISFKHATNISMVDYGDFIKADLRNPWDTSKIMQSFILVERDEDLPENLPQGTVLKVPFERTIIYTAAHGHLISELGAADAIIGVCDPKYMHDSLLTARVEEGIIEDCGASMAPNIEKMLMLKPEAIMLSAFENSNDHNKVAQLGIPVIDCTDYMETSPLARAEWMRFYGRLFGKGHEADSLFQTIEAAYLTLKQSLSVTKNRPVVLTELIYGQSWDVPAANSTIGMLIEHAGGANPFDIYKKSGSMKLAPEEVLFRAGNADVWLIKYYQDAPPTLSQLGADNPIYKKFAAFSAGNVYGCSTLHNSYFEDSSFHPDWILAEYARLLHPELSLDTNNRTYFNKLEN